MDVPPRSIRFPLMCAAAYAGGVIAYLPLLTLLLPLQVAAVAGDRRYAVLAAVSAVGAVVAGGGNLLFGWLSDRSRRKHQRGGRRGWIVGGLMATLGAFALFPLARTPTMLVVVIAAFQLALNAWLAPLAALIAEEVPARQIGLTTGLFAAGPPLASLLMLAFAVPAFAGEWARLGLIAGAMWAGVLPLLAFRGGAAGTAAVPTARKVGRRDLAVAWTARLLLQIAGNVVFADLVYLLADGAGGSVSVARTGALLLVANVAPLPVAVILGRWSDRHRRRRTVLVTLAMVAALGLLSMVGAPGEGARGGAFVLFSVGWNAFLALQVGYIIGLLPDPAHRGRDLGIVNLANTLPVLVGQGLTAVIATPGRPGPLLIALAGLSVLGGLAMLAVRDRSEESL